MSSTKDQTFYENQIERYLSQVIRAFSTFTVKDGVVRNGQQYEEKVPVMFGSPSRVVAAILNKDTEYKNVKVPLMAVNLASIEMDDESRMNPYHQMEVGYRQASDGQMTNVNRLSGVPLRLGVDLSIYASSVSQLMEILEKILLTFHPEVVIQKSTNAFDPDYITSIRMEGIANEITRPLGQSHRAAEMTLQFSVPVRISYPLKDTDPLEDIRLRVYEENKPTLNSDDIINLETKEVIDGEELP